MTNHCYIVTGAGRGLGLGLARAIAAQGAHLVAVGRHETPELDTLGSNLPGYRFVALDLADSDQVTEAAEEVFGSLARLDWDGVYLINNAGTVEPVAPAGGYDDATLLQCLTVNLSAAMQLGNAFIRHFQTRVSDRRIINISSGAGRKPYPSWSAYCASKAGLDMYSQCVGVEQAQRRDGIRIAALAPGIIDTGMQADIRKASENDFPMVKQFRRYKTEGELADPDVCGREIIKLMQSEHIGFGNLLDIRDFR
ncbi:SDR family NAD(P)-dependent oxidoreductase [Chitinimonas sp. BJB300]|uniref:SDR family NAD(P)-dependent oxidoreductase n=1 Tax=Chitinimonas sp. BJB300 TaxID=1559339 RepID=UPI000C0F5A54|nr:SDR family NAD(P)-dependent oxidoreductase [Chitinimonas sp. BJB300]PHV13137.1 short-chain dehydrogenase [Chitinimonas sp. BJB300]TSJ84734.1 SDR family NAD(P)-dependent oxidoreductase [Chitinimonas sp. BJB300]